MNIYYVYRTEKYIFNKHHYKHGHLSPILKIRKSDRCLNRNAGTLYFICTAAFVTPNPLTDTNYLRGVCELKNKGIINI